MKKNTVEKLVIETPKCKSTTTKTAEQQLQYEETKRRFQERNPQKESDTAQFLRERKMRQIMPLWLEKNPMIFSSDNPFFEVMVENNITNFDLFRYIAKYLIYEHDVVYKHLPDCKDTGYKRDMIKRVRKLYEKKAGQIYIDPVVKAMRCMNNLKGYSDEEKVLLRSKVKQQVADHKAQLKEQLEPVIELIIQEGLEEVEAYFSS